MPPRLRLDRVIFAAGPRTGGPQLSVDLTTTAVIVGPNNSGKSLALKEIERWCVVREETRKVVSEIQASYPESANEAEQLLLAFRAAVPLGQVEAPGVVSADNVDESTLRSFLLKLYAIRLDGRTRCLLSDPKPSGDLQLPPQNHLWALFQNDDARQRVRKLTAEAFGLHFTVDPTAMQQFRIRLNPREPTSAAEEQALDSAARAYHSEASLIGDLSDGVQAYSGLISAVMSLPHRVMLIDEPEAFLHPTLARRLGHDLADRLFD